MPSFARTIGWRREGNTRKNGGAHVKVPSPSRSPARRPRRHRAARHGRPAQHAVAAPAAAGLAPAADLLAATRKFLSSLEPDKRKAASFAWNGPEWRGWNYFGAAGFIKPGLRLEQMSAAQKDAAWDVLAAVLSPAGVAKTKNVMTLQDILAASGNGAGQRSSRALLVRGLRHAGRDRRLGLPARRATI